MLYFKWITNKDLLYSTENSAQCYVAAWMEVSLGENGDMCIYAEFLCSTPETITTSLIGFTPIWNKKLKKKKLVRQFCMAIDFPIKFPLGYYSDRLRERILQMIMTMIIKVIFIICKGHYGSYTAFTYMVIFNLHENTQLLCIPVL